MKKAKLTLTALAASLVLSACPPDPVLTPPIPTSSPEQTPTPTPTPSPSLGPLALIELANGNIVSDSFKLEFGPGSKGVKLEFGPGTKGPRTEFGPGSKGPKNLEFNVTLPEGLTNPDIAPFSVSQLAIGGALFLNQLQVEIIRDNQLYATASIKPRRQRFENIEARFHPGSYSIQVVAQTVKGPLTMSWSRIEVLQNYDAELKIEVFADPNGVTKPEDLDVEILTQNRKPPNDPPGAVATLSPEVSPEPSETSSPSPSPSPSVSASAEPRPTPSPSSPGVDGTL
ncbi:MAG: hypothetical protein CVV27_06675 [Candidatus Melainabacteria bacterium HGW-Melainabacteria-1]|nr:MAG: hypothetical protein CVV27_06675 [Candidatus Melainabacteria bacterium HGW-Melainabacteria-1]